MSLLPPWRCRSAPGRWCDRSTCGVASCRRRAASCLRPAGRSFRRPVAASRLRLAAESAAAAAVAARAAASPASAPALPALRRSGASRLWPGRRAAAVRRHRRAHVATATALRVAVAVDLLDLRRERRAVAGALDERCVRPWPSARCSPPQRGGPARGCRGCSRPPAGSHRCPSALYCASASSACSGRGRAEASRHSCSAQFRRAGTRARRLRNRGAQRDLAEFIQPSNMLSSRCVARSNMRSARMISPFFTR